MRRPAGCRPSSSRGGGGTAAVRPGHGGENTAAAAGRSGVSSGDARLPADRFSACGASGQSAAAPRLAGAFRLQCETRRGSPAGGGQESGRRGERLAARFRCDPERLPGQIPERPEPEGVRPIARLRRTARRRGGTEDLLRLESARAESRQSACVRGSAADQQTGPLHLLHRLHRRLLSGDRREAGRRLAGQSRRLGRTARRTGRIDRSGCRTSPYHLSARQFARELLFPGGVAYTRRRKEIFADSGERLRADAPGEDRPPAR